MKLFKTFKKKNRNKTKQKQQKSLLFIAKIQQKQEINIFYMDRSNLHFSFAFVRFLSCKVVIITLLTLHIMVKLFAMSVYNPT